MTATLVSLPDVQVGTDLRRLREAVNASAEIIFMTDAGGVITFLNRQFE